MRERTCATHLLAEAGMNEGLKNGKLLFPPQRTVSPPRLSPPPAPLILLTCKCYKAYWEKDAPFVYVNIDIINIVYVNMDISA